MMTFWKNLITENSKKPLWNKTLMTVNQCMSNLLNIRRYFFDFPSNFNHVFRNKIHNFSLLRHWHANHYHDETDLFTTLHERNANALPTSYPFNCHIHLTHDVLPERKFQNINIKRRATLFCEESFFFNPIECQTNEQIRNFRIIFPVIDWTDCESIRVKMEGNITISSRMNLSFDWFWLEKHLILHSFCFLYKLQRHQMQIQMKMLRPWQWTKMKLATMRCNQLKMKSIHPNNSTLI